MEALTLWFAPLLWIIGTITALVCFVRLCKPLWNFFKLPTKLSDQLTTLDDKITENFKEIDLKLDQFGDDIKQLHDFEKLSEEVQVNLLRERITQSLDYYSKNSSFTAEAYRSICDLYAVYKKHEQNGYIATVMDQIHALYKKQGN